MDATNIVKEFNKLESMAGSLAKDIAEGSATALDMQAVAEQIKEDLAVLRSNISEFIHEEIILGGILKGKESSTLHEVMENLDDVFIILEKAPNVDKDDAPILQDSVEVAQIIISGIYKFADDLRGI